MRPIRNGWSIWVCAAALLACGDDTMADGGGGTSSSSSGNAMNDGGMGGSTADTAGGAPSGGSNAGGAGGSGGSEQTVFGFPTAWPNGTSCGSEDPLFVWRYSEDTYILRQSLCTSFEGPFLYLLFGDERALLEDTGDGGIPLASTVRGLVDTYAAEHGIASMELVVMHSHAHGDHTAGDGQFTNAANTTVVGTSVNAVASFFGIDDWPTQNGSIDLGGRQLTIVPIPGHQQAHVAVYDPKQRLLLTGDTLYPGRLYIDSFGAYVASVGRLDDFVGAGHDVTWVLGTHIEMTTTPEQDFPFGAEQHPGEHELQLLPSHLAELRDAVEAMGGVPSYEPHADFIIDP